jgi:DNA helicase-2/ATP-dependent DNA helicase PcrA
MQKTFTDILTSLNSRQSEAVDTIYGPVLVIAWPGSGKTQILGARIANILATTDYLPSNILCLTFTENAAKNMRTRLASMIGQDAYRVAIHTFHSFGNEILSRYKYLFREYEDANTIDDIMSSRILDTILEKLAWNDPYKPGMRATDTIREILGRVADLKKWGITPALYTMILEYNKRSLDALSPLLVEFFERIDALGQKKDEKEKKISIFKEFTFMVQQLSVNWDLPKIWWYDSLIAMINRSLDNAWEDYEWDSSTKFMNSWRDAWTAKTYDWKRVWKESQKYEKQLSLAHIFEEYQKTLEEKWYIDFNDMILRAIELVERDPNIQANLAEQYQFILIDEYQDTNEAQMRLVRSILSVSDESPNIFAVGDDDQSIYKFQWANTKNIRDFHDSWTDTKLIILDTNYRSHGEIITTSRAFIKPELSVLSQLFPGSVKEFESHRWSGGTVTKKIFETELHEIAWIVDDISSKVTNWVNPAGIAVITKKNKSLELIGKWLLDKWIWVSMTKTESLFESELIILIINIIKYLASLSSNRESSEVLVDILAHPCWNIPRLTLWKTSRDIYNARKEENKSWIEKISNSEVPELRDIGNFMREIAILSHNTRLEDLIDMITGANTLSLPDEYNEDGISSTLQIDMFSGGKKNYTSPLYSYFFEQLSNHNWTNDENITHRSSEKARHLANMKKLVDVVRSYKSSQEYLTLTDAVTLLSLIESYDIQIETSHIIGNEWKCVNLTTVHKAKWLEWEHVYVPQVHKREYKLGRITGSTLPKNLPLEADKDDDIDIERLIYTAYTRAKDTLTITYSKTSISERPNEPLPCIELENGEWEEMTTIPINDLTETLEVEKRYLFSLPYLGDERDFLIERIEKNFTLSVTALQNFLNVFDAGPEYFISNNILRFPQAKNISASYGSAIHKALEDFFLDYNGRKTYMKEILHESFEEYLKKEWYPKETETEWLTRGHDNIELLYTELTSKSYGELTLEKDFRTEWGGVFLGDIQLTGKIDRIERLPDDSLIITDYKTGSGFDNFDGKWSEYAKVKQWKYRLQLAFYAILFELSPRYRMFGKKQYELFFVEQNHEEKRFHRVVEFVQQWEIERTKKIIIEVMKYIRTLEFPDTSKYEKSIEGIRQFEEDILNWQI